MKEPKSKDLSQKGKTKLINSIIINDTTELTFYVWEIESRKFGGIRKYVHTTKYSGLTPSGIIFSKKQIEDLLKTLRENREKIETQRNEVEVEKIEKSHNKFIIISLKESTLDNNPVCIDVREHVKFPNYEGPTKKGFRFTVDQIDEFISNCEDLITYL